MYNETPYQTHRFPNGIVEIHFDPDPCDPRKDFDHLAKMVCWHRQYALGDYHPQIHNTRDLWQDLATDIHPDFPDEDSDSLLKHRRAIVSKHFVVLPIYLYDHSGITISTGPFSCPWDSGQVGWIYVPMSKARAELAAPGDTEAAIRTKALAHLRSEVKEYDQYLTGQVFGFKAFSINEITGESEEIDSCWGFYGAEYALEEGKTQLPTLDSNREFDLAEAALA